MEFQRALNIYNELSEILKPFCKRIEVAGSVRRGVTEVKDIEIVAIADSYKLEKYFVDNKHVIHFNKNGGKYKQFLYTSHSEKYTATIDLFIASEDNFGLIFLIRTGSANFSKNCLVRWKQVSNGGYSKDGYLYTADGVKSKHLCKEEKDVFELLEWKFVEPHLRTN